MIYDGNKEYNERGAREHESMDLKAAEDAELDYHLDEVYAEEIGDILSAIWDLEKRLSRSFPNRDDIREKLMNVIKEGL